jgi:hypothetical protein
VNRFEATREVLVLEAAAGQLRERAKTVRLQLDADARAELEEHGSAPTWRLADLGTWSLPVSKEAPTVTDDVALTGWVKQRYPSEIVEVVNSAFFGALLRRLAVAGESVIDPLTGEVVPGLGVRPGGLPQTLRFKPNSDALAMVDQAADHVAGQVVAALRERKAATDA